MKPSLLSIQSQISDIVIDLKYAGTDNFALEKFYPENYDAKLVVGAVKKLKIAHEILTKISPELQFVVWDAARSHSVQKQLFEKVKGTDMEKYIAHPDIGSLHNYGCAIDLGLVHKKGNLLDMGTQYDYFGELAEPSQEINFVHQKKLSLEALQNRLLLRYCMTQAGFAPIPHEWWHFNFCTIEEARENYSIIA